MYPLDSDMAAIMKAAEAKQMIVKLKIAYEARQHAGGTGNKMGMYKAGVPHTVYDASDGWVAINGAKNHWIPLSACEIVPDVDTPPDDDPADPPTEQQTYTSIFIDNLTGKTFSGVLKEE
jgi:hypothetical protein